MKNHKVLVNLIKWITVILFPVFIYVSIKWSDLPIIDLPIIVSPVCIKNLFIKPVNVDPSMLNLATGYVAGYMVYILTVALPAILRNRPMQIKAAKRLSVIYRKAMLTILLMCKNVCSKEQWHEIVKDSDSDFDCFTDKYYSAMQLFDIKGEAETLFFHKDTMQPYNWSEYLEIEFKNMQKDLDDIFLQFHAYIKDDMLEMITELKNCHLLGMFTGKSDNIGAIVTDKDGYKYYDMCAIPYIYSQKGDRHPIFAKTPVIDNSKILLEFVGLLESLFKLLIRFPMGASVERDFAVS